MSAEQEGVRRTLALYAHRHDNRDVDGYAELFARDGSFVSARAEHRGRAAVKEFIADLYRTQPKDRRTKHLCGNSIVDVDGQTARAVTDFVAFERLGDGAWQIHTIGQYQDRLILEDGMWRFAERRVVTGAAPH